MLELIRRHATLDGLACAMIGDARFGARQDGTRPAEADGEDADLWLSRVCFLAAPDFDYASAAQRNQRIGTGPDMLERIIGAGGFAEWQKTSAALVQASTASRGTRTLSRVPQ